MTSPTSIYLFDKDEQRVKQTYAKLQKIRGPAHSRSIKQFGYLENLQEHFSRGNRPNLVFVDIFANERFQQESFQAYKWMREQISTPKNRFELWHLSPRPMEELPSGLYIKRDDKSIYNIENIISQWEDNPQLR
jgi:hypothetical protein